MQTRWASRPALGAIASLILTMILALGARAEASAARAEASADPSADASASARRCLERAAVERVLAHYRLQQGHEDEQKAPRDLELDRCRADSPAYKVVEALIFLEAIGPLPAPLEETPYDIGILNVDPARWVRDRLTTVVFDPRKSDGCDDGLTGAYVDDEDRDPIVHVCPSTVDSTKFEIAATLVHEARHRDPEHDHYAHAQCKAGRWAEIEFDGCDESFAYRGAYGADAEFRVRVSRMDANEAVDAAVRAEARSSALQSFLQDFNELPLGLAPGVGLLAADGQGWFFDGKERTRLFALETGEQRIVSVLDSLPLALDARAGTLRQFSYGNGWSDARADEVDEFRDEWEPRKRFALRDVYVGSATCWLWAGVLQCERDEKKSTYDVSALRPIAFAKLGRGLSFASADGYLYEIPLHAVGQSAFASKRLVRSERRLELRGAMPFEDGFLGLGFDGLVRVYGPGATLRDGPGATLRGEPNALRGQRYERIFGPMLWSKMLEGL